MNKLRCLGRLKPKVTQLVRTEDQIWLQTDSRAPTFNHQVTARVSNPGGARPEPEVTVGN